MHKILVLFIILLFTLGQSFAYSIKLYDEYGNRVGTYRKDGDSYQLYDFNDKKVDTPEMLIQNAPDKKTLTEYSQTFYDANMNPVGTWHSGYFGNNGRYYPRGGVFYPTGFYKTGTPYMVRPHANYGGMYQPPNYTRGTVYVDTRYAKFHQFKNPNRL